MTIRDLFTPAFCGAFLVHFSKNARDLLPINVSFSVVASIKYGSFTVDEDFKDAVENLPLSDSTGILYDVFGDSWERIAETLTATYNPVENYSKIEVDTIQRDKGKETRTETPTGGNEIENTQTGDFITETQTAPFDSETYHNSTKTSVKPGTGYKTTTKTTVQTGTETKTETEHETVNRVYESETLSGDEIEIHKNVTTGNIGVKTGSEMLTEEIKARLQNIFTLQVLSDCVSFLERGVENADSAVY